MFHSRDIDSTLKEVNSSFDGLSLVEVESRLSKYGANILVSKQRPSLLKVFLHQFANPLIFILCVAAVISYLIGDLKDAIFILIVIAVNAIIGAFQEYSAEKSAQALKQLAASNSKVIRSGEYVEIESEKIVIGDIVLLESGDRVPADLRLMETKNLEADESLLTGESLTVSKDHKVRLDLDTSLGDRINMAFSGSTVAKGRAKGIVIGTGYQTELGRIADVLSKENAAKPPLLIRMEDFTKKIAQTLSAVTILIAVYLISEGNSWQEVFIFCVALTVASIPEGLPISMTVALSIASRKMARRNVIVRKLPAVEALGSCTYVATDKTGTLTVNQLTVRQVSFPNQDVLEVSGSGLNPEGEIQNKSGDQELHEKLLGPLIEVGALCNEARLKSLDDGALKGFGDAVDLAFLILALKAKRPAEEIKDEHPLVQILPYESENQYAACLNKYSDGYRISVKGAVEKVLPLCKSMYCEDGIRELNTEHIMKQADYLADQGFKVIALANKFTSDHESEISSQINELNLVGLVGLLDPLRSEARESVQKCQEAGIKVAMVTGDHPRTSLAIARELGLAEDLSEVVSGPQLRDAKDHEKVELISRSKVFARVDPQQKFQIVETLNSLGEFTAVTGDGANDAPALNAANVGIAMGKSGTDVAKETADLIITDDRFATIVAGVEEGRVAYSNIRKVVYLLISTGMAELILFLLSLSLKTPMPLTAIQILWLNLVTNGIQDKGLAFEPGEGDELRQRPRAPTESVFDRLMIERVVLSALFMGTIAFIYFNFLIHRNTPINEARNLVLLLMVLFENLMILNCRSETKSAFALNIFRNKFLLIGTLASQLIHIAALYVPYFQETLGTRPVHFSDWIMLLAIACTIVVVMEVFKAFRKPTLKGSVKNPSSYS